MPPQNVIVQPPLNIPYPVSVDFEGELFTGAIWDKGYDVIHEQSAECPCKGRNASPLLTCMNCLGTGWVSVGALETRAIITSLNYQTKMLDWTMQKIGMAQITLPYNLGQSLSYMDKITVKDSEAPFSERLNIYIDGTAVRANLTYPPVAIEGVYKFVDPRQPLQKLQQGTDYVFDIEPWVITLNGLSVNDFISIRYRCHLVYYVVDIPHDVRNSYRNVSMATEENQKLPVQAVGRRAHYVLDQVRSGQVIDNT